MLNEYQRRAVERSLRSERVFLIHGPPGTGKTTTLVASIEAHVREGYRVLACADSNVAVDNILERLIERGVRAVRIGNPVRVYEKLRKHTLEEVLKEEPGFGKSLTSTGG
ncbi:MAG: AAA domain-containing protein [Aquificota bacterium]|nr:AAA domain-containing protein [Aquificota bacterium]